MLVAAVICDRRQGGPPKLEKSSKRSLNQAGSKVLRSPEQAEPGRGAFPVEEIVGAGNKSYVNCPLAKG